MFQQLTRITNYIPFNYIAKRLIDIPILLHWSQIPKKASILEVGCGTGKLSRFLSKKINCKNYTAIDIDPKMITKAESEAHSEKEAIFQVADVLNLPFDNESFDVVLSMDLLHHLPQWQKAIKEIYRVLKNKGQFLMRDYSIETFTLPGIGMVFQEIVDHPYEEMYDQTEFLTFLKKQGFIITHQLENPFILLLSGQKNSRNKL